MLEGLIRLGPIEASYANIDDLNSILRQLWDERKG